MNEFLKNKIKWLSIKIIKIYSEWFIKIVIKIYKGYVKDYADPTLEVWGVFLDILKSFDKVWHERLIDKLRQACIPGKAPVVIKNFLNNRF